MENYEEAIIQSKKLSGGEGNNHHVINHHSEFLGGELYVVEFDKTEKDETKKYTNYVYFEGGKIEVCKNPALLNELVARKSKKQGFSVFMESIEGIAGVIGLIVTLTIVYLLVKNPAVEIPHILSTSLTTILGFYFGTKTVLQRR